MQIKVLVISLIAGLCAFIGVMNSKAISAEHEEFAKYYENCIVKEIEKCNAKLVMLRMTKSKNLKEYAEMEGQKAIFFNAHKEELIKEMMEMQLEPKDYKMELFLNHRFQVRDLYRK